MKTRNLGPNPPNRIPRAADLHERRDYDREEEDLIRRGRRSEAKQRWTKRRGGYVER